jgi:hypothetical protein
VTISVLEINSTFWFYLQIIIHLCPCLVIRNTLCDIFDWGIPLKITNFYNFSLHLLQYYIDKIKEDEKGGAHGIYGGKERQKRQFVKSRHKWQENIKMVLNERHC